MARIPTHQVPGYPPRTAILRRLEQSEINSRSHDDWFPKMYRVETKPFSSTSGVFAFRWNKWCTAGAGILNCDNTIYAERTIQEEEGAGADGGCGSWW